MPNIRSIDIGGMPSQMVIACDAEIAMSADFYMAFTRKVLMSFIVTK